MQQPTVAVRAARIKLLALDIDGVLTDGVVIWDDQGIETFSGDFQILFKAVERLLKLFDLHFLEDRILFK